MRKTRRSVLAALPLVAGLFAGPPAFCRQSSEQQEPPPQTQPSEHHHDAEGPSPDTMEGMLSMEPSDRWMTMFHGYAFLNFNRQGGRSGGRAFESENHFMLVSMRRLWNGKLSLLGTFTAEPATIRPEGAPELFQRGETYKGILLVDRQHPHDLFVQIAAQWERSFAHDIRVKLYVSPWGEPAVGPAAYTHRLSASENPTAPLAHHNQDSTHISADVITGGFKVSKVTLEASAFHGREPDEQRYDIDQGRIDSYAERVTFGPINGLTFQVSAARRQHPEELEAGDQTRQTASVEYLKTTRDGFVAATLIFGRNRLPGGQNEWGDSLEATWKFHHGDFVYGRAEIVDRDLFELANKFQRPATVAPDNTRVQAWTAGYVRDLPPLMINDHEMETGAGGGVTFYRFDSRLKDVYGDFPVSLQVFLRVHYGAHAGAGHAHH